jgi:hypothetical protein
MIGDIKHIAVIESLEGEWLTGEDIYNNIIIPQISAYGSDIQHNYYKVPSKKDFINVLKYYEANGRYLLGGLLIHLEMHGNTEEIGLSDGSGITWAELIDLLRVINVATCNKLYITMATCKGRYLYQGVDPYQKSPYSGYISASKTITNGEIFDNFSLLFSILVKSGNLLEAYQEMEKTNSNFFYKDSETVFEENFKIVSENSNYRNKIIKQAKEIAQSLGQPVPEDDNISEQLYQQVLDVIYDRQKKAFDFPDC